jgi:hypothetical protein
VLADYKKNSNLPTIQVILTTKYTLSQYYGKAKGKTEDIYELFDLPFDVYHQCPLCGASHCAKFIGYYQRPVIDENGTYYKALPVARYLCRRKGGQPIVDHKTFSLLPYQLVPYSKYSIPFIFRVLKSIYVQGQSVMEVQTYLSRSQQTGIYIDLGAASIYGFKKVILEAISKLLSSAYYPDAEKIVHQSRNHQRIKAFVSFAQAFCCYKVSPCIRGPCALSYDFYMQGGGWFRNSYFLFGTPSQFRIV